MPRDEGRAKKHARIALIMCVAMLGAMTPAIAAFSKGAIAKAQPGPCDFTQIPDPTGMCPSPSQSASGSASGTRTATATRPATATATATGGTGTATATSTTTRPASSSPPPSSSSPTPVISPSRSPQTFNSPTKVTIKFNKRKNKFTGKVTSDFNECEAGRSMKLFYVVPGFQTSRKTGKGKSKANGSWSIGEKKAKGQYYASAKARTIRTTAGDTINCRKGKSRKITV